MLAAGPFARSRLLHGTRPPSVIACRPAQRLPLRSHSPKTLTRIPQIKTAIVQVRKSRYSIVDEQLEAGFAPRSSGNAFPHGSRVPALLVLS